ncbi:hypothetical protein M501DRAFT_985423 [Patellaria atrata CBS 101060]|uniref:Uncharacterized protein n=1 Tax=Patellaria atrata CBS 101060 TaxID=1346257 RepID=A0A9P4SHZ2_9PEZI|nr:hypothetical protein M501DRAFT_985423 [Patellaria atrata CBS 101060]
MQEDQTSSPDATSDKNNNASTIDTERQSASDSAEEGKKESVRKCTEEAPTIDSLKLLITIRLNRYTILLQSPYLTPALKTRLTKTVTTYHDSYKALDIADIQRLSVKLETLSNELDEHWNRIFGSLEKSASTRIAAVNISQLVKAAIIFEYFDDMRSNIIARRAGSSDNAKINNNSKSGASRKISTSPKPRNSKPVVWMLSTPEALLEGDNPGLPIFPGVNKDILAEMEIEGTQYERALLLNRTFVDCCNSPNPNFNWKSTLQDYIDGKEWNKMNETIDMDRKILEKAFTAGKLMQAEYMKEEEWFTRKFAFDHMEKRRKSLLEDGNPEKKPVTENTEQAKDLNNASRRLSLTMLGEIFSRKQKHRSVRVKETSAAKSKEEEAAKDNIKGEPNEDVPPPYTEKVASPSQ